jgi:raffinose/stachyose/melibiose transport system substrate-binding protein
MSTRKTEQRSRVRALLSTGIALGLGGACVAGFATSTPAIAGTVLKIAENGTQPGLSNVISRYEKLHPGVQISVTSVPSNTYQPTVRTELTGGNGPDLMFVWGGDGNSMSVGQLAATKDVAPLNGAPWIREMPTSEKKLFEVKGAVDGMSIDYNVGAFYYNEQVFKKAKLRIPKTFNQLLGACTALRKIGVTPIDLGNQVAYLDFQIPVIFADDIVYSEDPQFGAQLASGKTTLARSSIWHKAVLEGDKEYAALFSHHCVEPNSTATTDTEAIAAVASGKAGMTTLLANFQELRQDNPHGRFGSFEAPALNTPGKVVVTIDPGLAFAVNSHSPNKAAAKQFIAYLAEPSVIAYLSALSDSIPNVVPKGFTVPGIFNGLKPLINHGKLAEYPTNYFTNYQTKLTWEAETEDIATGTASPAAATRAVLKTLG